MIYLRERERGMVWVNWNGGGTRKIHGVIVGTVRNGKRVKRRRGVVGLCSLLCCDEWRIGLCYDLVLCLSYGLCM